MQSNGLYLARVTNIDGSKYAVSLFHWLGSPYSHEKSPTIVMESEDIGNQSEPSVISITAPEARKLAMSLLEAADKLDEGWR